MDYQEFTGKTVEEAVKNAQLSLGISSEQMEWQELEKESKGFFGIGAKPARIQARKIETLEDIARDFLLEVTKGMNIEAQVDIAYDEEESVMKIEVSGPEMGTLIGKRGQTLDSLQYLVSLVVNKKGDKYVRVILDTEDYRNRRKETLENLAKNVAEKVKKTRRRVSLEPMNANERRIIHAALQDDKYVTTKSEGEEPYRHVVVYSKNSGKSYSRYDRDRQGYRGGYGKSSFEESDRAEKKFAGTLAEEEKAATENEGADEAVADVKSDREENRTSGKYGSYGTRNYGGRSYGQKSYGTKSYGEKKYGGSGYGGKSYGGKKYPGKGYGAKSYDKDQNGYRGYRKYQDTEVSAKEEVSESPKPEAEAAGTEE
ncbi:MAG: protein jag [Lachnospiraceae bacterium]|nr:protein jag [Lachnospiraceae bacterium]